jgi:hypothetical protein
MEACRATPGWHAQQWRPSPPTSAPRDCMNTPGRAAMGARRARASAAHFRVVTLRLFSSREQVASPALPPAVAGWREPSLVVRRTEVRAAEEGRRGGKELNHLRHARSLRGEAIYLTASSYPPSDNAPSTSQTQSQGWPGLHDRSYLLSELGLYSSTRMASARQHSLHARTRSLAHPSTHAHVKQTAHVHNLPPNQTPIHTPTHSPTHLLA